MSDAAKGIFAILGACLIWGLSPIYYKLLVHVPPLEVLSHRTLWSLVFFGLVLAAQGRLRQIGAALSSARRIALVALATLMVSTNWFLFIYAIQVGRTVEASLGYYILPLVSVLLGMVFFAEKLSPGRLVAIGLAAVAVVTLSVGLRTAPVISLILAVTFGFYSVIKKNSPTGPVVSVTAEVLLVAPLSLIWLWGLHGLGWQGLTGRNLATFGGDLSDSLLLMLSGPLTGFPLILFSYASRRLNLATVGLVSYLNPTLQFLVAVAIFAELFTRWHAIAFPLIWLALAIYSVDALRQERSARRAAISAATDGTTVTNSRREVSANPSAMT